MKRLVARASDVSCRVQRDFAINAGLDPVFESLAEIQAQFPGVSFADLIVLAGGLAYTAAGAQPLPFCGGRVDAADGDTLQDLSPRTYYLDPVTAFIDTAAVRSPLCLLSKLFQHFSDLR